MNLRNAVPVIGVWALVHSSTASAEVPEWVNFPGREWEQVTPEQAGLDVARFEAWIRSQKPRFGKASGGQKPEGGGVVIARAGYLLHTWGDRDFRYQSASLGKAFTRMALYLAVDEGLIKAPTDLVRDYWTGAGELSDVHKYLTNGHHRSLTFRHLAEMTGGFPVTNGQFWRTKKDVPAWAKYTGDPDFDNYAHVAPGSERVYSSGGYWRLSQALTAIWQRDLKQVLDEKVMSKLGIPADRWEWLSGEYVRDHRDFYPEIPGYGDYLDPPYRIKGAVVRGGGGWVVMSALDFARLGLLVATGGLWKGERLISRIDGNVGVSANTMWGWGMVAGKEGYFSFGKVAADFEDPTPEQMASWIVGPPQKDQEASTVAQPRQFDAQVPMRDGVKLATRVWVPGGGSHPVVVSRGYWVGGLGERVAERFNDAGYAYVGQQCRGEGGAAGDRFFPDDKDGYDCVDWISEQAWCDGNVAMWGGSYFGMTCWRAALAQHPNLRAIIPGFMDPNVWKQGYRSHGAIHLKMTTQTNRAIPSGKEYSLDEWKRMLMFLPLIDMDREFLGREDRLWNDYISHSSYDDYWKALAMREDNRYEKVRIPTYVMAGFRDYYAGAAFESYNALKQVGATTEVRVKVNDIGHSGAPDIKETIRWLDYLFKGKDTGIRNEPTVKVQVRGKGWRSGNQWPLKETEFTRYYFSSPDGSREGALSRQAPGGEPPTRYLYDPDDPVLTLGANGSHESVPGLIEVGPVDQRPNETREDVLIYTTPPLSEDTEMVGPVEVTLYAASSATDTDFTVRLIDVHPDGRALNVTEGIVRARFRKSIWEEPSLITPGEIYEYRIELLPIAVVLAKGHRIRVHVASSNWPLWDRNQNTGNPIGMDAEVQVAEQTVYHDGDHPSHIVLPIIP